MGRSSTLPANLARAGPGCQDALLGGHKHPGL